MTTENETAGVGSGAIQASSTASGSAQYDDDSDVAHQANADSDVVEVPEGEVWTGADSNSLSDDSWSAFEDTDFINERGSIQSDTPDAFSEVSDEEEVGFESSEVGDLFVVDEADLLSRAFRDIGDDTLPNSPTKKSEALAMIMTFITAHNLPWTAVDDLLSMVNALFGASEVLPRSTYLFRKLWKGKKKNVEKHHYYCDNCVASVNEIDEHCTVCKKAVNIRDMKKKGCFFSILSIDEQMKCLLFKTKTELHAALKEREQEVVPNNIIR